MKIQHWAIIFIIIILPFSIIARNVINKKANLLREETRYNNIVDNAVFDATSTLKDVSLIEAQEGVVFGKHLPVTKRVADETVDRFFDTLAVNFNLPVIKNKDNPAINSAKSYFAQYIPAIIIVGYDGLYVYSYEKNDGGYDYVLKPKIPYSYQIPGTNIIINFTLDNYVYLIFSDFKEEKAFQKGMKDTAGNTDLSNATRVLEGYVGLELDGNYDKIDDFRDHANTNPDTGYINTPGYLYISQWLPGKASDAFSTYDISNDDPYKIEENYLSLKNNSAFGIVDRIDYVKMRLPSDVNQNLSYLLYELARCNEAPFNMKELRFLIDCYGYGYTGGNNFTDVKTFDATNVANPYSENYNSSLYTSIDKKNVFFSQVNIDYKYDDEGNVIQQASYFHQLRRKTIIDLITSVLRQEFNEHNEYAGVMGLKYDFAIPDIGRDQWNNTIDDISMLSFIQGMPMGYNTYYNNYSLGGARITNSTDLYGEEINDAGPNPHKVYHKAYCPLIPRDEKGQVVNQVELNDWKSKNLGRPNSDYIANLRVGTDFIKCHDDPTKNRVEATSGIIRQFNTEADAKRDGYWACSECM